MRVVIAIPVLGLLAGAAVGLEWPDVPTQLPLAALVGCAALALYAARTRSTGLLTASVTGAFAVGGTLLSVHAWEQAWRPPLRLLFEAMAPDARVDAQRGGRTVPIDNGVPMVVVGILQADASLTPSGLVSLPLRVEWAGRLRSGDGAIDPAANPADGGVLLTVIGSLGPARMHEWTAGRRIRASADLHRVARYLDPGVPDQERILARRGVTLVGTIKSGALVDVLARGSPAAELAARLRAFGRRAIDASVGRFSPQSAAIVTAIVLGDRTGLDNEVERTLQEAGTYHVIAISGGNIAILAGVTLAAFRIAGLLGRGAMLSAALGLVGYGYLVGGGASVDRATLMAVVYFGGRAWDMRGPPLHALALVAGLLTLADPLSIVDPASLLTFGATAAIVTVAPALPIDRMPRMLRPAVALLVATTAAEVALLPIGAAIFSRVTFAGLVLNFGAIPLMAVAQLAGMAVLPLYAVWPAAATVAGALAYIGAEGLVRTADLVALAPWSTWRLAPPSAAVIAWYYASAIPAWVLWRRPRCGRGGRELALSLWGRRVAIASTVAAGCWIVATPRAWLAARGDGRLHVTFIDVGQGDAALVRFPHGASLLVDAGGLAGGGSFDVGDRIVAPVLRDAGLIRLDALALSHGDADHIGGAPSVLREFRPWDVWEGVPVPASMPLEHLRASAMQQHARWTTVQRADAVAVDEVQIRVWHPPLPDWERQDVRNDDSIVLELRWHDVSFVFTGDIGREAEDQIRGGLEPVPLRVVKVPHHGSRTSSSEPFLRALAPRVAVVSVGRSNTFGHPSPVVLRRYEAAGAQIFRTDLDGAVTVDTDGFSLDVHTFVGRHLRVGPRPSEPRKHESHEAGPASVANP